MISFINQNIDNESKIAYIFQQASCDEWHMRIQYISYDVYYFDHISENPFQNEENYLKLTTSGKAVCLTEGYIVHSHKFGMGIFMGYTKFKN